MLRNAKEPDAQHDEIQEDIRNGDSGGEADGFAEAYNEDEGQEGEETKGNQLVSVADEGAKIGILDGVASGVRGGKSHGDDEIGGGEADQDQRKDFCAPTGQEIFENGDGALAGEGAVGDLRIDGERSGEGYQDED